MAVSASISQEELSSTTSSKSDATQITLNPTSPKSLISEEPEEILLPPTVPVSGISIQAHKLWIGNLDKRLTEQNILRFANPYGKIVSFKYMLYTSGIEKGEPRGYCFIEYSTREEADKAKSALNGKIALGKKLIVDWARQDQYSKKIGSTVSETWDASSVSATLQSGASTAAKIAALEAKLHQMDEETLLDPPTHQYYSQERVRRKHGGNIKIKHPQKVCQKPYNRTDVLLRRV